MAEITIPCATCAGTGWATHEDRHTETRQDRCRVCGGTGQVPARPGESRETSWPDAVPGAQALGPEIVRHRKTGGLYEVLFRGARVRTDNQLTDYDLVQVVQNKFTGEILACAPGCAPSGSAIRLAATVQTKGWLRPDDEVVIYRPPNTSLVWVRPTSEMDDGRFEAVLIPPADIVQQAREAAAQIAEMSRMPAVAASTRAGHNDGSAAVRAALRALHRAGTGREEGRGPDGPGLSSSYQERSAAWMGVAFTDDPTDGPERRDRTAEEVCEGYQSDGGTLDDWIAIGRYTFGRPAGALPKEIGQIVFTVACWAAYRGVDMMAEAERELARCFTPEFIEKLARKRATRHGRGPLPGFSGPETSAPGVDPRPVDGANSGGEAPGGDAPLAYEVDGRGAWTWLVWAIQPAGPQLAAIAASEARAEAYRDAVAQNYPGSRFFTERAPVNHAFGASDLLSIAGRAAAKAARQGYASPRPSYQETAK